LTTGSVVFAYAKLMPKRKRAIVVRTMVAREGATVPPPVYEESGLGRLEHRDEDVLRLFA
jgi:hypothetical protein